MKERPATPQPPLLFRQPLTQAPTASGRPRGLQAVPNDLLQAACVDGQEAGPVAQVQGVVLAVPRHRLLKHELRILRVHIVPLQRTNELGCASCVQERQA